MIDSVSNRMIANERGSSLAAAAAAAAAAIVATSQADGVTIPAQKNPFAIQELLGLTSNAEVKSANSNNGPGSGLAGGSASSTSAMGANFPPISCYNTPFFNSNAVADQYSHHQRMYFNSAGLFGNLHHQSQSFATSTASHLLDSTLRNDHLSSKSFFNSFEYFSRSKVRSKIQYFYDFACASILQRSYKQICRRSIRNKCECFLLVLMKR